MNLKLLLSLLFGLGVLFVVTPVQAATKVKLEDIYTRGTKDSDQDVLEALIRAEIKNEGSFEVVEKDNEGTITGTLIKLDTNYILQLNLDRPGSPSLSRQAKAASFGEIDVAVKRVIEALASGKSVENTAKRGTVMEKEQQAPSRIKSISGAEVFVGAGYPFFNPPGDKSLLGAFSLGHAWDVRRFLVEIRGDLLMAMNGSGVNYLGGSLAASYIFVDDSSIGIFAGPEFGFGFAGEEWSSTLFGFEVGGSVGLLLLRETDISLDARFKVTTVTKTLAVSDSLPVFGTFLVGLHF
ncbi:MAG: hypothetical protein JST16_06965 [Bdellovibrionales bacterium]|nr:hypothetical protein [Bdellovibrionales bacterium]